MTKTLPGQWQIREPERRRKGWKCSIKFVYICSNIHKKFACNVVWPRGRFMYPKGSWRRLTYLVKTLRNTKKFLGNENSTKKKKKDFPRKCTRVQYVESGNSSLFMPSEHPINRICSPTCSFFWIALTAVEIWQRFQNSPVGQLHSSGLDFSSKF